MPTSTLHALQRIEGVALVSKVLEEVALFEYDGVKKIGVIKGVDSLYHQVTDIDTTIAYGKYVIDKDQINYAVLGSGLSGMLGVNHNDAITPVTVYMLLRKPTGPLSKDFKTREIYPSAVFHVNGEPDLKYAITNYDFVNRLLDYEDHHSSLEIKLAPLANEQAVRKAITSILGDGYTIKNKYQQNGTFLKIMNIEKWVSYLIAVLTLLLIGFNLICALWMIVLDKRKDISILQSFGYTSRDIQQLFIRVGLLITIIGLVTGIVLALVIYVLQKEVGLVHLPENLAISAYPIELNVMDFVLVSITVLAIGGLASWLPSRVAGTLETALR